MKITVSSFRLVTICCSKNRLMISFERLTFDAGLNNIQYDPRHDKTNKMAVRPAKTQISLGIRPVWSGSSLSAWRKLGFLGTHWAHSEDSDQTGRMPRLIWVFAGRALSLLVLSCRGSYVRDLVINKIRFIMWRSSWIGRTLNDTKKDCFRLKLGYS